MRSIEYHVEKEIIHAGHWMTAYTEAKMPTLKEAIAYIKRNHKHCDSNVRLKIIKVTKNEIFDLDSELIVESCNESDAVSQKKAMAERDEANGYPTPRDPNASYNDWDCLRGIDVSLRRIADVLEDKMKGNEQ